jgi:hypothetical protein
VKKKPFDTAQFTELVKAILVKLGAKEETQELGILNSQYEWLLETKVGPLGINLGGSTVFTRFHNPQLAHPLTDCNPHSGKWNFFYFDETPQSAAADLEEHLRKIL